jgi:hypothetical protein
MSPRPADPELPAALIETVGAENLCHQAIFMNHASGAVAPPDAERVQVGDII